MVNPIIQVAYTKQSGGDSLMSLLRNMMEILISHLLIFLDTEILMNGVGKINKLNGMMIGVISSMTETLLHKITSKPLMVKPAEDWQICLLAEHIRNISAETVTGH